MSTRPAVLAVIAARGGSKGLPGKNVREVGGKPMIAWTIEAALQAACLDRAILSSDDEGIIEVARRYGCDVPYVRPAELAQDDTSGMVPVLHAIRTLPEAYDYIMLLQPTSPLRTAADIEACVALCFETQAQACVSVTPVKHHPWWTFELSGHRLVPLIEAPEKSTRRQELPKAYGLNGAIYMARTPWLEAHQTFVSSETVGYVMPAERSVDVDTEFDLAIASMLLGEWRNRRWQN